ncbi:MAG: hypothetical protein COZ21_00260, partial [Bacteroidetes bacterium CG_4_10_14_3_um_filter_31_20]
PKSINIYKAIKNSDKINIEKTGVLNLTQKTQILNIGDFCNECGNCTTFCPTNGKPFKDKPKFYLTEKSFNEVENGFMLNKSQNITVLLHKTNYTISSLSLKESEFIYENINVKATFSKENFDLKKVEFLNENINEFEFTKAAKMFVLFYAAGNLY